MTQNIILICSVTLILSSLCGYFRFRFKRLSFYWFLFIHLPIPFIWGLRFYFGVPLLNALPFTVLAFALGQWLGLRYAKIRAEKKAGE